MQRFLSWGASLGVNTSQHRMFRGGVFRMNNTFISRHILPALQYHRTPALAWPGAGDLFAKMVFISNKKQKSSFSGYVLVVLHPVADLQRSCRPPAVVETRLRAFYLRQEDIRDVLRLLYRPLCLL